MVDGHAREDTEGGLGQRRVVEASHGVGSQLQSSAKPGPVEPASLVPPPCKRQEPCCAQRSQDSNWNEYLKQDEAQGDGQPLFVP